MDLLIESDLAYLALKAAEKYYGKSLEALQTEERLYIQKVVRQQAKIENHVLQAPEAHAVCVPPTTVQDALAEVRKRYADEAAFAEDLTRLGLTESRFADALNRELKVEAVLAAVATRAEPVSPVDIELYYHYHPEQFHRPETRHASHILITVNDTLAENTRPVAQQRIQAIAARLAKQPSRFAEQALKHSECPTALQAGALGEVPRGKLFPALDAALFELRVEAISGVLESELGFHLLRCTAISPARTLTLPEASPAIHRLLTEKRKRAYQQSWLKQFV